MKHPKPSLLIAWQNELVFLIAEIRALKEKLGRPQPLSYLRPWQRELRLLKHDARLLLKLRRHGKQIAEMRFRQREIHEDRVRKVPRRSATQ